MGMKTTKSTKFPNQNENASLVPNEDCKVQNNNPTRFYCKEETKMKQGQDKKTYQKLVLNKLKTMGNSTSIYTY